MGHHRLEPFAGGAGRVEALGGARVAEVEELRDKPVIIFMLPDLSYIEDPAAGLLASWSAKPPAAGTAVVVMSSVSPAAVKDFGARVARASGGNAVVVDAPVSGGTKGAVEGTLAIMAGASEEDFQRLLPLFSAMGSTVRRLGPLGSGSLAKACNQLIVGTTTAALAEAAELAERSGMDVAALYDVLAGGWPAAGSWTSWAPARREGLRAHRPGKIHAQGPVLCARSAAAAGAAVPMAEAGVELYAELKRQGLGDRDLAVVRQAISNLSDSCQRRHDSHQPSRQGGSAKHEWTF